MQLKRVPYGNKLLNCFEHMIVSVASIWDRDNALHFACSWGFEFAPRSEGKEAAVGERLYNGSYMQRDLAYHIERYFGIILNTHMPANVSEVATILGRELERGQPVGTEVDSFWCPFHPVYQKQSLPHNFLFTGYDESTRQFECIDSLFSDHTEMIDAFHLEQAPVVCYTFDRIESFQPPHWTVIAYNAASRIIGTSSQNNAFEAMRRFADEVAEGLNVQEELEKYPWLQTSSLFLQLHTVAVNRYKFSETLACLSNSHQIQELGMLAERLHEYGNMWQTVEHLILKSYYMKERNRSLERVAERIRELADLEQDLAEKLLQCAVKAIESGGGGRGGVVLQ